MLFIVGCTAHWGGLAELNYAKAKIGHPKEK